MMYARTEFIYAVLLVASFLIEGSQATFQVEAAIGPTPSPSPSPTVSLTFNNLSGAISCEPTTISWLYSGSDNYPLTIQVTNLGVPQDAPPPATTSSTTSSSTTTTSSSTTSSSVIATTRILKRATSPTTPISPMNITISVVSNYQTSALSYPWDVNAPAGWYILLGTISTDPIYQSFSSSFYIRTGSNTSCLTDITSTTNSHTPTTTPSSNSLSPSSRPVTSIPAADLSSTSTSKVPTIVGVIVGMAVLAIGLLLLWFILRRKRGSRTVDGGDKNNSHRWKGFRDPRGGFKTNAPNKRYRSTRSLLTSQHGSIASSIGPEFEGGNIGAEKKSTDGRGVALSALPVLHHQTSRTRPDHTYSASSSSTNLNEFGKSCARYSIQPSIDSSAVYPPSLRESGQYMLASDVLRSHSMSTTGTHHSLSNTSAISSPPLPPPSSNLNASKQMHRESMGGIGKKRKPAPVYDPSEDEPLSSTSAIFSIPALQHSKSELSFPELSHKNSFGPGGIEGKPLHYLIPDMPVSQHS